MATRHFEEVSGVRPIAGDMPVESDRPGALGMSVAMRVTVSGSRQADEDAARSAFGQFLDPFVIDQNEFLVGGAAGVDTWALDWLLERRATVTVVVPATVDRQPQRARRSIIAAKRAGLEIVELRHPAFPHAESFRDRNCFMVDRSELVVGCPLAGRQSGGTWQALRYAAARGLPYLVAPLPAPASRPDEGPRAGTLFD